MEPCSEPALTTTAQPRTLRPNLGDEFVERTFRPVTHWAASRALSGRNRSRTDPARGRFTPGETKGLVDEVWHRFDAAPPDVSSERALGARLNVRLAAVTIAMLDVLSEAGIERSYAIELISDVTWKVYEKWGSWGGHFQRGVIKQMEHVLPDGTVSLNFPFSPPSYVARAVKGEADIAFNMVRCPVAELFKAKGAADLCVAAWCNLDYALGEIGGLKLVRTKTLVQGDSHCDFRWFKEAADGPH